MIAGKTKFIAQSVDAAIVIPNKLSESKPKKTTATEPLAKSSVIAIVGIIDIVKKVSALIVAEEINEISTSKKSNNK
jgi:hypothetical protein